ncbi:MAG: GtrA family protein, partial [Candidatus Dormiibacterota bacterium]
MNWESAGERVHRSRPLAPLRRARGQVLRAGRFAVVGLLGLAVNQGLLWALVTFTGMSYLLGAVVSSQGSTLVSYLANEFWVFRGRHEEGARHHWVRRLIVFDSLNTASLLLRLPVLFVLTSGLHVNYLISNLVAVGMFMLVRFFVADTWIWRAHP